MLYSVNLSVFANKYFITIFFTSPYGSKSRFISTLKKTYKINLITWKIKHHKNLYKIFMTFAIKEIIKDII